MHVLFHLILSILILNIFQEINNLHSNNVSEADIPCQLSPWAAALFKFLPSFIRREVMHDLYN